MKTLILFCLFICSSVFSFGQITNDSISIVHTDTIIDNIDDEIEQIEINYNELIGRYKLYSTHNTYNFLKLDTKTGQIWKVQWHTSYNKRFETYVSREILAGPFRDQSAIGRFELQKTENIWTFLLLDTITGEVWQVQWGLDRKDNMLLKIY